jgi:hypothetical protein
MGSSAYEGLALLGVLVLALVAVARRPSNGR